MSSVTAFIDNLRLHFGRNEINQAIREGLADGTFHAAEDGHTVGVRGFDDGDDGTVRLSECFPWNQRQVMR